MDALFTWNFLHRILLSRPWASWPRSAMQVWWQNGVESLPIMHNHLLINALFGILNTDKTSCLFILFNPHTHTNTERERKRIFCCCCCCCCCSWYCCRYWFCCALAQYPIPHQYCTLSSLRLALAASISGSTSELNTTGLSPAVGHHLSSSLSPLLVLLAAAAPLEDELLSNLLC